METKEQRLSLIINEIIANGQVDIKSIAKKLNLNVSKPDLRDWESVLQAKDNSNEKVMIAMVG